MDLQRSPSQALDSWLDQRLWHLPGGEFRLRPMGVSAEQWEEEYGEPEPPIPHLWDFDCSRTQPLQPGGATDYLFDRYGFSVTWTERVDPPRTYRNVPRLHRQFAKLDTRSHSALSAFARNFGYLTAELGGKAEAEPFERWTFEITRIRLAIQISDALKAVGTELTEADAAIRIATTAWATPNHAAESDTYDREVRQDTDWWWRFYETTEVSRPSGSSGAEQFRPLRPPAPVLGGVRCFCPEDSSVGFALLLKEDRRRRLMVSPLKSGFRFSIWAEPLALSYSEYLDRARMFLDEQLQRPPHGVAGLYQTFTSGEIRYGSRTLLANMWRLFAREVTRENTYLPRVCRGCGRSFVPHRRDQQYCRNRVAGRDGRSSWTTDACRQLHRRRQLVNPLT